MNICNWPDLFYPKKWYRRGFTWHGKRRLDLDVDGVCLQPDLFSLLPEISHLHRISCYWSDIFTELSNRVHHLRMFLHYQRADSQAVQLWNQQKGTRGLRFVNKKKIGGGQVGVRISFKGKGGWQPFLKVSTTKFSKCSSKIFLYLNYWCENGEKKWYTNSEVRCPRSCLREEIKEISQYFVRLFHFSSKL